VRVTLPLAQLEGSLSALTEQLGQVGEVLSTMPSSQPAGPAQVGLELWVAAASGIRGVEEAVRALGGTVSPLGSPRPAEPDAPLAEPEGSLRSPLQTVRVDIRKLDGLMNLVGELQGVKANLSHLAEVARQSGGAALSKLWGQELTREARVLERRLEALQQGLLEARMVPLHPLFDKLARLVRRIGREVNKPLVFSVQGGDVELDKLLVEGLSDPLMHLLRNAIDHGLEPPAERASRGKGEAGQLWLSASQKGNHVVIEVRDDGAGIDEARVREVALAKGLADEATLARWPSREVRGLLFSPGFTTARNVSSLSGRGVGLDVVKTNVAQMSGIIDVVSEPGRGTTFTLTLPVTLAIQRALVVQVSGRTYAVPLNSVVELLSVSSSEVRTVERREVITLRGQTLPLSRLARLFSLPDPPRERLFVVVAGLAQERVALAVDELLGQQDIVLKPLGRRMGEVPGIAGATELGNRQTVLVLDVGALLQEALREPRSGAA
jgi:two-component system chemotaxis sensor kinase CheA